MLANRVRMATAAAAPAADVLIGGDLDAGFYGEVSQGDFIPLTRVHELLAGRHYPRINDDTPWLKFAIDGKTIYKTKMPIAHSVQFITLLNEGLVYGGTTLNGPDGKTYKVRLMKGANTDPAAGVDGPAVRESEWNRLMLPITINAATGDWADSWNVGTVPYWGIDYTNADLGTVEASTLGSQHWCQEYYPPWSAYIARGYKGVSFSGASDPTTAGDKYRGWSPVLEEVIQ